MRRIYPMHVHISTLFLLVILVVSGTIGGISYFEARDALQNALSDLTRRINHDIRTELERVLAPAETAALIVAKSDLGSGETLIDRWKYLDLITEALKPSYINALYVGYDNGDFFSVQNIVTDDQRKMFDAPKQTRFIVRSIERAIPLPKGRVLFLDESLQILDDRTLPDFAQTFDPRSRNWYADAMRTPDLIQTKPYLFFTDQKVGTTIAARAHNHKAVIGVDILLETFGEILSQQKVTPGTHLALVNADGFVIGYEDEDKLYGLSPETDDTPTLKRLESFGVPVLSDLGDVTRSVKGAENFTSTIQVDGADWHIDVSPLPMRNAPPLYLVICIPDIEMFQAALRLRSNTLKIAFLIILFSIPVILAVARSVSRPLKNLAAEAKSIQRFDFSNPLSILSFNHGRDERHDQALLGHDPRRGR